MTSSIGILLLLCADRAAAERPNVVLVITDDQGYGDLGATGNPVIKTPNLDALARQSAAMTTFYVSPVCTPTRASLMTGRWNYRTRAIDTYIGRAMMEPEEVTLAEILREAGYATGIFGKWHLGDNFPMRAMDQGFEESLVHRGGGIGQPSDPPGGEGRYTDAVLQHNGQEIQTKGYCTDVYFDHAMQWIEKSHGAGRNFFVYLPTNCPHSPFNDVPREHYEMYQKIDLSSDQFPQNTGHKLPAKSDTDQLARIYAMITNIDDNVGRLMAKLDALDLTDNTIVIFMCDNGPNGRRYVAGMRGAKADVHEGGIRSPFFVHWPARLEAGHASDRIAAHVDILPTLLEACGVEPPDGLRLDGLSLLPLLSGDVDVQWPDRTIFIQSHRGDVPVRYHNFAARSQRWKLLNASGFGQEQLAGPPRFELYDMEHDPLEMHDLAANKPEVVAMMKGRYDAWFDDVSSTRPENYAPPRIYVGTPHENPVILTRQDWRRTSHDSGWNRNSIGHWLLHVAAGGKYDIRLRFPADNAAGKPAARAELKIAGQTQALELDRGATSCVFREVQLESGEAKLEAVLTSGDQTRGAYQVDVTRR